MAILCRLHDAYGDRLIEGLRAALPGEDLRLWPEIGDPAEIDICLVFRMPPGFLAQFPNLKLVSSTGAGIDHFMLDPDLSRHIPFVRVVDEDFASRMADYVCCWTLFHHREVAHFLAAQQRHEWSYRTMRAAREVVVGVMGLGQMGGLAARRRGSVRWDAHGPKVLNARCEGGMLHGARHVPEDVQARDGRPRHGGEAGRPRACPGPRGARTAERPAAPTQDEPTTARPATSQARPDGRRGPPRVAIAGPPE